MSNTIPMYRMLTKEVLDQTNLSNPHITFQYESEDFFEKECSQNENHLNINEIFPDWTPSINDLEMAVDFDLNNIDSLFGPDKITGQSNRIGLALHIHSKTNNYQKTLKIGTLTSEESEKKIVFNHRFDKGLLRGKLYLDFFVYLDEVIENNPYQGNIVGQRLSIQPISAFEIVIDGTGSSFPILEEEKENEPLWRLKLDWTDIYLDSFDVNHVALILNTSHSSYKELHRAAKSSKGFLGEIMLTAMTTILQKILLIDKEVLNMDIPTSADSIVSAVKYWIETYELDINDPTLEGISYKLRKQLDEMIYE